MPGTAGTPETAHLFTTPNTPDKFLTDDEREHFHSITAKLLYLSNRTRPDILTEVAFLTKRVLKPQRDYVKLVRTVQYIRGTQHMGVTFEVDKPIHVIAYIDASYGIYPAERSHTGSVITLGRARYTRRAEPSASTPSRARRLN